MTHTRSETTSNNELLEIRWTYEERMISGGDYLSGKDLFDAEMQDFARSGAPDTGRAEFVECDEWNKPWNPPAFYCQARVTQAFYDWLCEEEPGVEPEQRTGPAGGPYRWSDEGWGADEE
jgi:hypothetical protein